MPAAEWIDAGLLDPDAPGADERRALLEWLEAEGCTLDELVAAAEVDRLESASADKRLRPPPSLTREDVAERCGVDVEVVDRAWLAAGFPPPPAGEPFFTDDDLVLFRVFPEASSLFGEDTLLAFTRVMGASMARIAEAADAMFLADVEAPRRAEGVSALELARIVDGAVAMLAGLPTVLAPLFRRHAAAAIDRSRLARSGQRGDAAAGPFRVPLTVGFADLVGFTALAERSEPRELAAVVGRFERAAADRCVAAGVRLVKSIGDAVMVVGPDPVRVVDVLLGLAGDVADEPALTGLRAAAASGEVLAQGGDYVGPTVNLAARATKEAEPGAVVVDDPIARVLDAAGRPLRPLGPTSIRGLDDPVVLWEVLAE